MKRLIKQRRNSNNFISAQSPLTYLTNTKFFLFFLFFSFLFSLNLVSAVDIGSTPGNADLPTVVLTIPPTPVNYSDLNVNNSFHWQGYIPSTLPHNLLAGLDGGSNGEYYHLNASVFNYLMLYVNSFIIGYNNVALTNQSNTFQGNQIINGNLNVNGTITGNFNFTNFNTSSLPYVPYQGANANVNLSAVNLSAFNIIIPLNGSINFQENYPNNFSYFIYNSTSKRLELWVNGKIQQDWGNSTTIYGKATFQSDAFFQNLSGQGLFINTNVLVDGYMEVFGNISGERIFGGNICYSDGTNCTYINSTFANLTQMIIDMNSTLTATINSINTTSNIMALGFWNKSESDLRYLSGGVKSFYFTNHSSDVPGMFNTTLKLSELHPDTTPLLTTVGDGETLLSQFISPIEPLYLVSPGKRTFYLTAQVNSINKVTQLHALIWKSNLSGGNMILLRNSTVSRPLTLTSSPYQIEAMGDTTAINSSERIVFQIYAIKEAGGPNIDVTLYIEDATYSRLDVPSPVGVTDISGKLDATDQRYNDTDYINSAIGNLSFLKNTSSAYLYNSNTTIYFNDTHLNETISDLASVRAYTLNTNITVAGGTGTITTSLPVNYVISRIIVTPPISTANYRFEAREFNSTGLVIDADRITHHGTWDIDKFYSINNSLIYLYIHSANQDGAYNVQIKYINNKVSA